MSKQAAKIYALYTHNGKEQEALNFKLGAECFLCITKKKPEVIVSDDGVGFDTEAVIIGKKI